VLGDLSSRRAGPTECSEARGARDMGNEERPPASSGDSSLRAAGGRSSISVRRTPPPRRRSLNAGRVCSQGPNSYIRRVVKRLQLADHPEVGPLIRPRGESQRARLLVAAFDVVGERGIQPVAVADIVRAAGVSRGTFYQLFGSKEDCFIAAYQYARDMLLDVVNVATLGAMGDWQAGLRAAIRAYLTALTYSPRFARAGLVEIQNAGDSGHAEHGVSLARFADAYGWLFQQGAKENPKLRPPSSEALFVLVAGIEQLVAARVREGYAGRLPQLEDSLVAVSAAVFLGVSNAGEQVAEGDSSQRRGRRRAGA
jgi:AcrR family transcriptional regulator